MAVHSVTSPKGETFSVNVPDGVTPTREQLIDFVLKQQAPKAAAPIVADPAAAAAPAPEGYGADIASLSTKYGVDPALVTAVVRQESNFNPKAVSPKGAQGLMQLMPPTAKQLGVADPFNPQQNLEGGIKHIKYLLDKYQGNHELAVAAYNAGEGNVDKHKGIPPFPETQDYVKKVLGGYVPPPQTKAPAPEAPPEVPQQDLGKLAVQAAKHGVLSNVTTPIELATWAADKANQATSFALRPATDAVRKLLEKAGVPVTKETAPTISQYTNPVLERVSEAIAGPKPEPKTGKEQTVALAAGLGGAIAPLGIMGAARYGGRKLLGAVLPDIEAGVSSGLKGLAGEARAPKAGVGYHPPEPFDYGVSAGDEAKIVKRANDPNALPTAPKPDGILPTKGTVLDPAGASAPGKPPYQTYWGRTVGKVFPHLPVLEKVPESPVVTISQQRAVNLGNDMAKLFDQPFSQFLYKGGTKEDFTRMFAQWEANGFKDAPADIKAAKAWLEGLRPREQAAAKYLGERTLDDVANYWPHMPDTNAGIARVGRHETGIISEIRSTLGMFEETRKFPTMLEGMANGIQYGDPRQAYLIRVWSSLKMIHTAEYLQNLERTGVLSLERKAGIKAAEAIGAKAPVTMQGIPGGERFARSPQEAHFIAQQLRKLPEGPFGAMLHWGNAVLRNPNLINPLPHLVRNMSFKYWWSGGSIPKLIPDFREFLVNGNPQMIALFKQYMPFEYSGKTAADLMHEAIYKMNHPVLKKITNDYNLLWRMQRWSSSTIFTRWDPAIKYARFKQYVNAGMNPQQAANNVNVDLIDYGMRSEVVDWWKSIPLDFFVPWRTGTAQSFTKQLMHHPIRTALFIGGVDYLRETMYRKTGWWVHLPIDYIEAPIAQIIRGASEGPDKFRSAVQTVLGTAAMFGPGGASTLYQWQNIIDLAKGTLEWPKIKQMFWGLAIAAEPYGAVDAFNKEDYVKVLQMTAESVILGAHQALESRPKRGWEFAPESIPGLGKSQRVQTAEAIQKARELRRDIRGDMPARPKIKDILP